MFYTNFITIYQSLLVSASCATFYEDSSPRKAIIHLLRHPVSFTLFIDDQLWCFRACSYGGFNLPDGCWSALPHYGHSNAKFQEPEAFPAGIIATMLLPLDLTSHFKISKPTPNQPLHGLAKVEEATLQADVGKVALNGRDQGCF
ncbi:hypothetical protein T07_12140 [Trichinella nelsoni]|uniref:Uncharacterized protein n=1 Tax=Trichinella nelsoni TaxID=6336 RepID=A0A0V0SGI3_9BILA|nr:hypothetical protein T07_12140 [Trichinella nelsoni]